MPSQSRVGFSEEEKRAPSVSIRRGILGRAREAPPFTKSGLEQLLVGV